MSVMSAQEASRVQNYMQRKFGNSSITVRAREKATDSVEVLLDGEFMGVIYKDEEDGETSYDFNMAILEMDLVGTAG